MYAIRSYYANSPNATCPIDNNNGALKAYLSSNPTTIALTITGNIDAK